MKKILTAVAIASAAVAAQAQGFYLGAGVGFNKVTDNLSEFNSGMVDELGGTISSSQDSSVNNLRLVGGYKINENVAFEVGYINTSKYDLNFSGRSGGNVAYSGNGNVSFSGFDVSAVLRPSIASGYNNFFATVGIHNYKAKMGINFVVDGDNYNTTESYKGTGAMFGVGYDFKVSKDLDLRATVTRINKLAGESDSSTTNIGIVLIKNF